MEAEPVGQKTYLCASWSGRKVGTQSRLSRGGGGVDFEVMQKIRQLETGKISLIAVTPKCEGAVKCRVDPHKRHVEGHGNLFTESAGTELSKKKNVPTAVHSFFWDIFSCGWREVIVTRPFRPCGQDV